MSFDHAQQLVSGLRKLVMAQVGLVDKLKIEPGSGAQLNNGRQVEREHQPIFNLAEGPACPADDSRDAVGGARAFLPGLKADKRHPGILPLTAEAEAVNGKHRLHVSFFFGEVIMLNLIQHLLGTGLCSARRELHHGHENTLVFFRQERGRQAQEQHRHTADNKDIDHQIAAGLAQNMADAIAVVRHAPVEQRIEPAEESAFRLMMLAG